MEIIVLHDTLAHRDRVVMCFQGYYTEKNLIKLPTNETQGRNSSKIENCAEILSVKSRGMLSFSWIKFLNMWWNSEAIYFKKSFGPIFPGHQSFGPI